MYPCLYTIPAYHQPPHRRPQPDCPASLNLSPRRRSPQSPRTYHAGILKTVLDSPGQIPALRTGVPTHMAGFNSPAPTTPASHIHPLLLPACPRHIASPPYRRPQPEWSGVKSPILTTPLPPIPPDVPRRHP